MGSPHLLAPAKLAKNFCLESDEKMGAEQSPPLFSEAPADPKTHML